jgi:putative ABC transport system permease protein
MLAITLADLRMRFRQFLIAVVGAGLTFSIALLLTGMVSGFHNEIERTVASARADLWVLPNGTTGPYTSVRGMPGSTVSDLAADPGVDDASGLVLSRQSVIQGTSEPRQVMMIGAGVGRPGQVTPDEGDPVGTDVEAVVDERLGIDIGEEFTMGETTFEVVGLVSGMSLFGGIPDMWISLGAAQDALFQGEDIVTAVVVQGKPDVLPAGLVSMTGSRVEEDSLGPMKDAVSSVNSSKYLMWTVATVIIAALIYVSALQRTRDFAVLKAVGASSGSLFLGVAIQAVLVSLAAAGFAIAISDLMLPVYTVPVEVPASAYLLTPAIAAGVGVLSSLVALRQAVKADPALAFGSS